MSNSSSTVISNTIIHGTEFSGGIHFEATSNVSVIHNDFSDNVGGDLTGSIPNGLGTLAATNTNGDSCDVFFNIFLDPIFYSTTGDSAFHLTENSPCIDAGDPASPPDPDGTVADIGAFYIDQMGPDIELSAALLDFGTVVVSLHANLPLTIYNVGTDTLFLYDIYSNLEVFTTNWTPAQNFILPDDSLRISVIFTPDDTIRFEDSLWIDNNDEIVFVELMGQGEAPPGIGDRPSSVILEEFALRGPYPNPFNSRTTLVFTWSQPVDISLVIYDAGGREVGGQVLGWHPAGQQQMVFNASDLPSGVYFASINSAKFSLVRRIILLK